MDYYKSTTLFCVCALLVCIPNEKTIMRICGSDAKFHRSTLLLPSVYTLSTDSRIISPRACSSNTLYRCALTAVNLSSEKVESHFTRGLYRRALAAAAYTSTSRTFQRGRRLRLSHARILLIDRIWKRVLPMPWTTFAARYCRLLLLLDLTIAQFDRK